MPFTVNAGLGFGADACLQTASARVVARDEPAVDPHRTIRDPAGSGPVRLVGTPGIDRRPCGATHVRNIAEIGAIRGLRIRGEGKRNRRVEIALDDRPPA
jgi:misacylated tRNA(Ala) deacylase